MSIFKKRDIAHSFKSNKQLQPFFLNDVTTTGKMLGTGSFGSVEEVMYQHTHCAGKKLHEALIECGNEGISDMVSRYLQECQLMSRLNHPNITQFLGLCFLPGTQLPVLVMEKLYTNLDDLLEHVHSIPLFQKCSVLEDVTCGLLYLHTRKPLIVHRDLTARNILLTESLTAKITDMGNSRILDLKPGQMAKSLTRYPGTLAYMPPEAMDEESSYGPSIDVFSLGHLALYTVLQESPDDLLPSTFPTPDNVEVIKGRSEVERRVKYIKIAETNIGWFYPEDLIQLIKDCLRNEPKGRPSTDVVLTRLSKIRNKMKGKYEEVVKLDVTKLNILKQMEIKDSSIEQMIHQQESLSTELMELRNEVEEKNVRIAVMEENIRSQDELLQRKDGVIKSMEEKLASMLTKIIEKDEELCNKASDDNEPNPDAELPLLERSMSHSDQKEMLTQSLNSNTLPRLPKPRIKEKKFPSLKRSVSHPDQKEMMTQSLQSNTLPRLPKPREEIKVKKEMPLPSQDCKELFDIDDSQMQVIKKVGNGEFGDVSEALWKGIMKVGIISCKMEHKRFMKMAELMKVLQHPNIVKLCGVCETPLYIAAELSENLHDYLQGRGRKKNVPHLINMCSQIADGMKYLESNHCVHRDLTARNVMVMENATCKVAGFHLAYRGVTDHFVNTKFALRWAAPEAVKMTHYYSIKSDVWSFGVVIYEAITHGEKPYADMDNMKVIAAVSEKNYRMPIPKGCPEKLYEMMLQCWNENPDCRPTFETLQWQLDDYYTTTQSQYRN